MYIKNDNNKTNLKEGLIIFDTFPVPQIIAGEREEKNKSDNKTFLWKSTWSLNMGFINKEHKI